MNNFKDWLAENIKSAGGLNAACLNLDDANLQQTLIKNGESVKQWLAAGYAGEMNYLERMLPAKISPQKTFPGAKSVIVITFDNNWGKTTANHSFPNPPEDAILGYLSAYAKEQDYHITGNQILQRLHQLLQEKFGPFEAIPGVDTKPVFERTLAVYGGLGILGPNDLLRTPDENVRVFIGSLFCQIELPEVIHEVKMPFPCKFCQNCIENCPTGALSQNGIFDAPKCISYLTIEKKSVLDKKERQLIGDWLFGCDLCTVVCPPKDKVETRIPIDLAWLLKSPSGEIHRLLKGTAVEYAGVTKLRRNAVAILRENGSPQALELLAWAKHNLKSPLVLEQINVDR